MKCSYSTSIGRLVNLLILSLCFSHSQSLMQHLKNRRLSTDIRMSSTLEEEVLLVSEKALKNSDMAKQIQTLRSANGKLLLENEKHRKERAKQARRESKQSAKPSSAGMHPRTTLSYTSALEALKSYHSIHHDLALPRRFIVPKHPSHPREWHGVDLASTVYNMKWWKLHVREHPSRVAELNQIGFIWERLQPEWNLILGALITYSAINGNLRVPVKFVVPRGDDAWPKATWGIVLGNCIHRMRLRNDFLNGPKGATRRSQLVGLGFVWDMGEYAFDKFLAALRHYATLSKSKHDDGPLKVSSTFEVPEDPSWPRELWRYPLGAKCSAIRQKGLYVKDHPERKQQLSDIGFCWEGNASLGWYKVVHAAAIYSQMNNGNLEVPITFRVPSPMCMDAKNNDVKGSDDAWPWPEHLWNFPLGQRLKDIRLKAAYLHGANAAKRRAQLDALGFKWKASRGRPRKRDVSS